MYQSNDKIPRHNYTQRPQFGTRPIEPRAPYRNHFFIYCFYNNYSYFLLHARAILLGPAEAVF